MMFQVRLILSIGNPSQYSGNELIRNNERGICINNEFNDLNEYEIESYRKYCMEDKPELAKKLCIADRSIKEIMDKLGLTETELVRIKDRYNFVEKEQSKNETSIKSEIKSLIAQVNDTKMRLFKGAERLCRDEGSLRELNAILGNKPSMEYITKNMGENLYVNEVAKQVPGIHKFDCNHEAVVLKESNSKMINCPNNIASMLGSMSYRGTDKSVKCE